MDKLAVELLAEVFGLAFTDGGYTARSVALVNKHFHAVSTPLRFQSVALKGSDHKLEQFLESFTKAGEEYKGSTTIRVRHLYLEADIPPAWVLGVQGPQGTTRREILCMAILRAVADCLETLTCTNVQPEIMHDLASERHRFPRLRELSVSSPFDSYFVSRRKDSTTPSPPEAPFPVLEHLHLINADMVGWEAYAPSLTHLRLTALHNEHFVDGVIRPTELAGTKSPLSRLSTLIFQVQPYPPRRLRMGEPCEEHESFVQDLWASQAESDVPVYFLPPLQRLDIRGCWESRIEGGEGCWAVEEQWARASYADVDVDVLPEYLQAPPLEELTPAEAKRLRIVPRRVLEGLLRPYYQD
ncbi:hypothetical protein C8Q73DRAFT_223889 [Cubamyces lactineus]|nr:hypothetical protein C8Q73DRAFT_223889 [Cubamyces lactineus]